MLATTLILGIPAGKFIIVGLSGLIAAFLIQAIFGKSWW